MPKNLNRWMLSAVLHNFIGTLYCTSEMKIIILTVLENMHPLHNSHFLWCKIATITRPKIVKAKLIYIKILHSVLISFCVTAPTSSPFCKTGLAGTVLSFLCLHSKYIAKGVASKKLLQQ